MEGGLWEIKFYRATGEWGFLSNLYKRAIVPEEDTFRGAEDAYQFGKPKDRAIADWIVSAPKPHLCAAASHALLSFPPQFVVHVVKRGEVSQSDTAPFFALKGVPHATWLRLHCGAS